MKPPLAYATEHCVRLEYNVEALNYNSASSSAIIALYMGKILGDDSF